MILSVCSGFGLERSRRSENPLAVAPEPPQQILSQRVQRWTKFSLCFPQLRLNSKHREHGPAHEHYLRNRRLFRRNGPRGRIPSRLDDRSGSHGTATFVANGHLPPVGSRSAQRRTFLRRCRWPSGASLFDSPKRLSAAGRHWDFSSWGSLSWTASSWKTFNTAT